MMDRILCFFGRHRFLPLEDNHIHDGYNVRMCTRCERIEWQMNGDGDEWMCSQGGTFYPKKKLLPPPPQGGSGTVKSVAAKQPVILGLTDEETGVYVQQ